MKKDNTLVIIVTLFAIIISNNSLFGVSSNAKINNNKNHKKLVDVSALIDKFLSFKNTVEYLHSLDQVHSKKLSNVSFLLPISPRSSLINAPQNAINNSIIYNSTIICSTCKQSFGQASSFSVHSC